VFLWVIAYMYLSICICIIFLKKESAVNSARKTVRMHLCFLLKKVCMVKTHLSQMFVLLKVIQAGAAYRTLITTHK
jgi:hypothetical protein